MIQEIHERALKVAARFKRAEADLISILQEVEASRVYVELEFASLFQYCVKALGLSEPVTSNFVTVSRKAAKIPGLQSAIQNGLLTVSIARKITPVLTLENQEEWVEKAQILSCRKLEEAVARVLPREATPERMKVVSEDRVEVKLGISKAAQEKLKRIQDLESQRTARPASLEDTLEALLEVYLEAKDPVRRAARVMKRKNAAPAPVTGHVEPKEPENQEPIPAVVKHQVSLRDGGQCVHRNDQGERCLSRRWIHLHHIRPRSQGGPNSVENLVTLCSVHHGIEHDPWLNHKQ
jgi:5-methylcytosine-specific restriction endonuclease McrA